MYNNLRAEIARKGVTMIELAQQTGMSVQRLSRKMNQRSGRGFLFSEALAIKKALGVDIPLETLFEG